AQRPSARQLLLPEDFALAISLADTLGIVLSHQDAVAAKHLHVARIGQAVQRPARLAVLVQLDDLAGVGQDEQNVTAIVLGAGRRVAIDQRDAVAVGLPPLGPGGLSFLTVGAVVAGRQVGWRAVEGDPVQVLLGGL